jgi:diguanylate cyclase (GGDEF)-like protein
MAYSAVDSSALLALIRTLLSAQALDDVGRAIAHGAQLVSPYEALSLYQVQADGSAELMLRQGAELGPGALAVEELLCGRAVTGGSTVSTLDMLIGDEDQPFIVRDHVRRQLLCLARPLNAYGEVVGVIVFHYSGRVALPEAEFSAQRRFIEFAAIALSNAHIRNELRGFAYSDPLTGLQNRRWLEIEFARLQGTEVSLLLVDFDGLKAVNDALGYDRGDVLIHAIGLKLAESAEPGEFVARLGGDEFVLVMSATGRAAAIRRAEELTQTLDGLLLPDDLRPYFRGASVGSATASADEDLWEVLGRASVEMRSRKRRRKTDRELLSQENPRPRVGDGWQ